MVLEVKSSLKMAKMLKNKPVRLWWTKPNYAKASAGEEGEER